jgi:ATP-dependent exoDNAse (exonuclease V) beta subunit
MTDTALTFPADGVTQCDILNTGYPFSVTTFSENGGIILPAGSNDPEFSRCQIVKLPIAQPSSDVTEAPRYVSPSKLHSDQAAVSKAGCTVSRIDKNASYDRALLGDCIHNIFCLLRQGSPSNVSVARDLLAQNAMTTISAAEVVATYEEFLSFLVQTYGPYTAAYHELPFFYAADGQIVRGSIDFVYETPSGCILVDYKTNDVGETNVLNDVGKPYYAGHFAGQFHAYAEALAKSGKTVIEKLIFYPATGLIVHID